MHTILKYSIVLIALAIGNVIYQISVHEPVVVPDEDIWWGPGEPQKEDSTIRPFKINISDEVLLDLKQRLERTRPLTPPLEGVQHQYGLNTNLLNEILKFWQTKYDWRERERFLNQFPQYQVEIQGLKIHYIHIKPENLPSGTKIVPLMLVHSWPGSVREFYELIPLLMKPQVGRKFVFEVIVPSIPGYGFSESAHKPGLGAAEMAVIFKQLMTKKLGFDQFYVKSGAFGVVVSSNLATFYPDKVKGLHISGCLSNGPLATFKLLIGSLWPSLVVDKSNEHRLYPLKDYFARLLEEFDYLHIQATKPDTIGVALTDSPAGLAAYVLQLFITWTDRDLLKQIDGGLNERFDYTKLLDNVMIYWVTNSITTSMRMYAESMNKEQNALTETDLVEVPTACSTFKNDPVYQPMGFAQEKYVNIVQSNELDGGHYNALEVPQTVAKDIFKFVEILETKI